MEFTIIPSVKGQLTIPSELRKKYNINKNTPLIIKDKGKGLIEVKVMQMIDYDEIEYYENEKEIGLNFKNGIDPQILINEIKKIDG